MARKAYITSAARPNFRRGFFCVGATVGNRMGYDKATLPIASLIWKQVVGLNKTGAVGKALEGRKVVRLRS